MRLGENRGMHLHGIGLYIAGDPMGRPYSDYGYQKVMMPRATSPVSILA